MRKKLYILVRSEFSPGYVAAQASHALANFALNNTQEFLNWNNQTIVILGVRYPQGIYDWEDKLKAKGVNHSMFFEPDQFGQPTALVCYDTGELFKDLKIY
jgi:hypothetical protein